MDLHPERRIDEAIDRGLANRVFPGIVCGVWKDGREVCSLARGYAVPPDDPDFPARPMTRDTPFDLASLTKPLSTAILAMQAVESGALRLTDTVSRFLPGAGPRMGAIAVCSLLTHTGGLPAIPALEAFFPDPFNIDRGEAIDWLLAIEPERGQGQAVVYSCTGFMLLGLILEKISGLAIGELFRCGIASPLGLAGAGFAGFADFAGFTGLPAHAAAPGTGRAGASGASGEPVVVSGAAPTELCAWRKRRMAGQVHDESSWCLGGQAGNAGLFANLDDVATIASLFLQEGAANGVQVLGSETVRLMTTVQTAAPGERRSLGLRLHDNETLDGPAWPDTSFGHTGFTGTSVFMDPETRLMAVCLTNRVYFGREKTVLLMPGFRREFHTAVYRNFA